MSVYLPSIKQVRDRNDVAQDDVSEETNQCEAEEFPIRRAFDEEVPREYCQQHAVRESNELQCIKKARKKETKKERKEKERERFKEDRQKSDTILM